MPLMYHFLPNTAIQRHGIHVIKDKHLSYMVQSLALESVRYKDFAANGFGTFITPTKDILDATLSSMLLCSTASLFAPVT